MPSNLSNHQLTIDCYRCRMSYMNHMVTTDQKPVKDTQKIKRRESSHNTKESQHAQGKGARKEERISE